MFTTEFMVLNNTQVWGKWERPFILGIKPRGHEWRSNQEKNISILPLGMCKYQINNMTTTMCVN